MILTSGTQYYAIQPKEELHMYPFSYTSIKVIHDQKVREALEQQHFSKEQKAQGQDLLQAFKKLFVRSDGQSAREQSKLLPDCTRCMGGSVS